MTRLGVGIRRARLDLMLAVAVLAVASVGGQQPPGAAAVDVTRLGPQMGERVPGFTLNDQGGTRRSLEALMGPKGMLLVFLRSADW